jgi:hypothetical protein
MRPGAQAARFTQTNMTISQLAKVHEVGYDVVCTDRFYADE